MNNADDSGAKVIDTTTNEELKEGNKPEEVTVSMGDAKAGEVPPAEAESKMETDETEPLDNEKAAVEMSQSNLVGSGENNGNSLLPVVEMPTQQSEEDTDESFINKMMLGAAVIILLLLVAFLLLFEEYYNNRLYPYTIINGFDMSNLSADEIYGILSDSIKSYRLEIEDKDGAKVFLSSQELGLNISNEKMSEKIDTLIKEQKLDALFTKKEYRLRDISEVNRDTLTASAQSLEQFNPKETEAPLNAYIEFDESAGKYIIKGGTLGNRVNPDYVNVLETAALNYEAGVNLLEAGLYPVPDITDDNEVLVHNLNLFNEYIPGDYVLDLDGLTETLTANQYYSWFIPNYEEAEANGLRRIKDSQPFSLDEEKLKEYSDYLYNTFNTFGAVRDFVTTAGTPIKLTQGDYGWWINPKETRANISEALLAKSGGTIPVVYYQKAASHGPIDYGNSYVEINLSSQYVWLYYDGSLILESGIVTGMPSAGNATPPGIYSVTYTERDAVLRGPGYVTRVSYWMPFNMDIGLHDATWQTAFGGNRYLAYGSNGCINLPFNIAKEMFDYVVKEFPVILYY